MPDKTRFSTLRTLALIQCLTFCASAAIADPAADPKAPVAKLYVVPYAHLDTQWRWAYPQVIREYVASTLHDNFALIEKYPNYVFNFSGSRRYEFMKEYYPEDFEKLRGYVQAGRWFPCGSSVDENDANVPSSESFIRHILYGNRYFKREFGVSSSEFMLPDCFGFPYALPTMLSYCGIKGFSTQKLTWGSANGIPFKVGRWIGPDGTSVVAALDPGSYSADVTEDLSQNTSWLARIMDTGKTSGAYVDYHYYGTGDTGGSPRERAVQWVEKSVAGTGPVKVISTRADAMFNELSSDQIAKMPSFRGELLLTQHSAGSISSQAYMKRWNRKSELLADAAERASVTAMWLKAAQYPSERLYRAWDLVLGSQMHDMLPGTSIPKAYEFCWNDYLLAQNQFAGIETNAVAAVAASLDTRASGIPLVVYNPTSYARRDVVLARLPQRSGPGAYVVTGPDGTVHPTQVLRKIGGDVELEFLASSPSMGFSTWDARWVQSAELGVSALKQKVYELENQRLRVKINVAGDLSSVFDKVLGKELLKRPSRLEFQYHNPSAYPAWNMDWDDAKLPPDGFVEGPAEVTIAEDGPVSVAVTVTRRSRGSRFMQTYRLIDGDDRLVVDNEIDWQTKEHALKASFPLTCAAPKATYELQVGTIERGVNDPKKYEVPQHRWLDQTATDGSYGVAILNDSKYGSDKPTEDTVRLTLLYTPGVRSGFADQATQDFGRHHFTYALAPHAGDWRGTATTSKAARLNQSLRAFIATSHAGAAGKSLTLGKTSAFNVEISAVKKAEDNATTIVRLRETSGRATSAVRLTLGRGVIAATEVDGQERRIGDARLDAGAIVCDMPAYGLKSFAVQLAPAPSTPVALKSKPLSLPFSFDATSANREAGAHGVLGAASYPAEMLPTKLTINDVPFALGSTQGNAKNALFGAIVPLPAEAGAYDVAVLGGGLTANASVEVTYMWRGAARSSKGALCPWTGFLGSWDNRLWDRDPGPNFNRVGEMVGLTPGYIRKGEAAWYSTHIHNDGADQYYQFGYLGFARMSVPAGATQVKLVIPKSAFVMAATRVSGAPRAAAASPLFDAFEPGLAPDGPRVESVKATDRDGGTYKVMPPLYGSTQNMTFTADGTEPTPQSAHLGTPFELHRSTVVRIAQFDASGHKVASYSEPVTVRDDTAPSILAAIAFAQGEWIKLNFSEPLDPKSASDPSRYRFSSGTTQTATLGPDHKVVTLQTKGAVANGTWAQLIVDGVADLASPPNALRNAVVKMVQGEIRFDSGSATRSQEFSAKVDGLPLKGSDSFTLNFFCKIDKAPLTRILIAGFGRTDDDVIGAGRYFTNFPRGINFWASNRDVGTTEKLDVGAWQMLTACYDGHTMRLYKNGKRIAKQDVELGDDVNDVRILPLDAWERERRFEGAVRQMTIWNVDLPEEAIQKLWSEFRP